MPRPTQPLLSRANIVEGALRVMDRDGFEAFSLPRLGEELGVRTPSLYYHFRDRAELMAEVARTMVRQTRLPQMRPNGEWEEWFVDLAVNFRRAILEHRNAAPVLLQFLPRDVMVALYENAAMLLARQGVPRARQILILDGLEKLTLGTIMVDAMRPEGQREVFANVNAAEHPHLAEAQADASASGEELLARAVRAFMRGTADGH